MKKACIKCGSDAYKINPAWAKGEEVYACSHCGTVINSQGAKFLSEEEMADVCRMTTLTKKLFPDFDTLPVALSSVLFSRVAEFGTSMWMDGLKQGLLYGQIRDQERSVVSRPKK